MHIRRKRNIYASNTRNMRPCYLLSTLQLTVWSPDSSVGIAARYGLEGPRIDSRWGPHPSIPVLGPTLLPIQWVPGLSRGVKRPGRGVDHRPLPSRAEVKERVELYLYSLLGLRNLF